MSAEVVVPATSANLGPGFDSFGLALALYNRFTAERAAEWSVEVKGEGADCLPTDGRNAVAKAMAVAFREAGVPELKAHITSENRIPPASGLGSSSAAVVGGLLLGERLAGVTFTDERRLALATDLEGHPDNVAAALLGGFTICWEDDLEVRATCFQPGRGLAVVVVRAETSLSTRKARLLLPSEVTHEDASFNVAHAALLAASIVAGRPDYLDVAVHDRLHEPYREAVVPDLANVRAILRAAGASAVAMSGSGPTVVGLVAAEDDQSAYDLASKVAEQASPEICALGGRMAPEPFRIDRIGACIC